VQPDDGTCQQPERAQRHPCNDSNVCTTADACQGGTCTAAVDRHRIRGHRPAAQADHAGPDGNLWFISPEAVPGVGAVARIVPASGAVTTFLTSAAPRTYPLVLDDIVTAADGNLWFTGRLPENEGYALPALGTITPAGTFIVPDLVGSSGAAIALGPDGNLWTAATSWASSTPSGASRRRRRRSRCRPRRRRWWRARTRTSGWSPRTAAAPRWWAAWSQRAGQRGPHRVPGDEHGNLLDIAAGPDGNLWFTDAGSNEIGRITTTGAITKFPVPTAASGVHGIIAGPTATCGSPRTSPASSPRSPPPAS
jgi:streptogramin lyase